MSSAMRMGWLALCCLWAFGCAPTPSGFEVCNDYCSLAQRCGGYTQADVRNCQVMCQSRKSEFDQEDREFDEQCSNRADFYNAILSCHQRACDELEGCLEAVSSECVPR